MKEDRKCRACGRWIVVEWSDGAPVRSWDVHTLVPSPGGWTPETHPDIDAVGGCVILHNGCPRGDEESPVLERKAG